MATHDVEDVLFAYQALGTLYPWEPSRPLSRRTGRLFLTTSPRQRVGSPWSPQDREELRQQTLAVLDAFVENGRALLGLVDDAFGRTGIAQMKILSPKPGVRLFGALVDPDTYVGTRLLLRDELPFKPSAQSGTIDYRTLGQDLAAEWSATLQDLPCVRLKQIRKYL